MKKLLSILAAVGLTATASTAVVACGSSKKADSKLADNELSIQTTADKTFGEGLKVDTLTNLLKESTDDHVKAVASHVKSELGLDNWFKDGEPVMITTYFGTKEPSFKDGAKLTDAEVNKDSNTDANKASFANDAKAGKTLYVALRNSQAKLDNDKKQTVAVLKLDFKAVVVAPTLQSIKLEVAKDGSATVTVAMDKTLDKAPKASDVTITPEVKDLKLTDEEITLSADKKSVVVKVTAEQVQKLAAKTKYTVSIKGVTANKDADKNSFTTPDAAPAK